MSDVKDSAIDYVVLGTVLILIVFGVGHCIRGAIKEGAESDRFRAMPLPIRETDEIESVEGSRYRPTRWYVRDEYGVRYVVRRHARKAPTRRLLDVDE